MAAKRTKQIRSEMLLEEPAEMGGLMLSRTNGAGGASYSRRSARCLPQSALKDVAGAAEAPGAELQARCCGRHAE